MRHRVIAILVIALTACSGEREEAPGLSLAETLGGSSSAGTRGFARATAPRDFVFPRDHHSHPAFRNEWWYLTGNLGTVDGREFGYQLTFFRIALAPEGAAPARASTWATREVWMAHAAVTDIDGKQHYHSQRLSRGAAGLAGNSGPPFRLWLDDWHISGGDQVFPWQVSATTDEFGIQLDLAPRREVLLQGNKGLSQKSPAAGNASYYYSVTRLATTGFITVGGNRYPVGGLSWLDREWSTSALGPDQAGWDWFSLQLDSGEDVMYYQLRKDDGVIDPLSRGSWLGKDGEQRPLVPERVKLTPVKYWQGPDGTRYPIRWRMVLDDPRRVWIIAAALEDQLMETVVTYWEGTVNVLEAGTGSRIGRGYLEMTGYRPGS
jgi:predicted secreted hydrolase